MSKAEELQQKIDEIESELRAYGCNLHIDLEDFIKSLKEQEKEIRKIKKQLWTARAAFCGRSCEYFGGMAGRCKIGQMDLYKACTQRKDRYLKAFNKCRSMVIKFRGQDGK